MLTPPDACVCAAILHDDALRPQGAKVTLPVEQQTNNRVLFGSAIDGHSLLMH